MWQILSANWHAQDEFPTDGGVFANALALSTRCLSSSGFHHSISLRSLCACHKKNGLSRFTIWNRFPLFKGTSLLQCHCDQYKMGRVSQICFFLRPVHIEPSAFTRGSFPPSALSPDLVWQPLSAAGFDATVRMAPDLI